jgi:phage terminase large subunit-like protein
MAINEIISDRELLAQLLQEKHNRFKRRKFYTYYPETGPLRRELYQKHMFGFKATAEHKQVWAMAGNRTGKTEGWLLYAITCAVTGRYPDWWMGRRWTRPVTVWLASTTGTKTRDVLQKKLLGPSNEKGTGLIPADDILNTTAKSGISEAVDTLYVKHISGGTSIIQFKSYDQGRAAFEGAEIDIAGLDEEPPLDVYGEIVIRLMTVNGSLWASFTPLEGMTELIVNEYPDGFPNKVVPEGITHSGKFVFTMTWDEVPHLTEEMKEEMWRSIPAHLRDARKKGLPIASSGIIYPYSEEDYLCKPFPIPDEWKKAYGFDVGWNKTAAAFGAIDPNSDTCYLYSEHYLGQKEPPIHASAIKNRGAWIPGVIDPASRGRQQADGKKLINLYREEGLDLYVANNAREAGILKVGKAIIEGKLKIFNTLPNFSKEIRLYRRDEHGDIVKENDHLMDATRYLIMSGLEKARVSPVEKRRLMKPPRLILAGGGSTGWMGL